jgi:hypothetical protein
MADLSNEWQSGDITVWLDGSYTIDISEAGQPARGSVLFVAVTLPDEKVSLRLQGGPS